MLSLVINNPVAEFLSVLAVVGLFWYFVLSMLDIVLRKVK